MVYFLCFFTHNVLLDYFSFIENQANFPLFFQKIFYICLKIEMNTSEIKLELFRQIDALPENIVVELKIVVQRYLQQRNKKIALTDADINSAEIQILLENSTTLDFLKADEEDIYSDADLNIKY